MTNLQIEEPPVNFNTTVNREVKPDERQPVFWFKKKESGEIFCAREKEAWEVFKGRSRIRNKSLMCVYLGKSDGSIYFGGLKEMREIAQTKGVPAAQDFLRELHKKEMESADTSARPRNNDRMGDEKALNDMEGISL